jgi:hypothetical protein
LYHLLLIKGAEYAFHHNGESAVMSALFIGAPGMSKSLSVNLYTNYYIEKAEKQENGVHEASEPESGEKIYMLQHLCSRASEADCLQEHFIDVAENLVLLDAYYEDHPGMKKGHHTSILLDEIGLANLNQTNPLKIIHGVQDKGVEIGHDHYRRLLILETSCYAANLATQNRGMLHCSGFPTKAEFVRGFALTDATCQSVWNSLEETLSSKPSFFDDALNPLLTQLAAGSNPGFSEALQTSARLFDALWSVCPGRRLPEIVSMRPLHELMDLFTDERHRDTANYFSHACVFLNAFLARAKGSADLMEKTRTLCDRAQRHFNPVVNDKPIDLLFQAMRPNYASANRFLFALRGTRLQI